MAFSAVPFALQNVAHSAQLFRQAMSSVIPPGGGVVSLGDLAVAQTGTPSMAVQIGVGRCYIPGTNVANVSGGNFSSQAMYYAENESVVTATIASSDPTNPRIDMIYVAVNDTQYSGSVDGVSTTFVVSGTPASGATYPTNAPSIPNNAIPLAWVRVGNGVTSITNTNIHNVSVPYNMRHMEWTSTSASQTGGSGQNFGTLSLDTANTYNGGFATGGSGGTITLSTGGIYIVSSRATPGGSAYSALQLWAYDQSAVYHLSHTSSGYGGQLTTGAFTFAGVAGATLTFGATWNQTATMSTRVKMTKVG